MESQHEGRKKLFPPILRQGEMMVMNDEVLKEIEERCNAATLGPWVSCVEGRDHDSGSNFIMTGTGAARGKDIELTGATIADQDFIAHAREDIPQLLAEIRRLKSMLPSST